MDNPLWLVPVAPDTEIVPRIEKGACVLVDPLTILLVSGRTFYFHLMEREPCC